MGTFKDLSGQEFGYWTVLERDYSCEKKNIHWVCKCKCGNVRSIAGNSLRSSTSVSCGCLKDKKTSERTRKMTEDLSGKQFGEWTVVKKDLSEKAVAGKGARWICRCSCGKEKSVLGYSLRDGRSTNCGHNNKINKRKDLVGKRYGKLVVTRFAGYETSESGYSRTQWECKCDCGNTVIVKTNRLSTGEVFSCGCEKNRSFKDVEIVIGEKYGYWTVLGKDTFRKRYYTCKCECGKIKSVTADSLKRGTSLSCGCMRSNTRNLVGQRFERLFVVDKDKSQYGKGVYWLCKCDCGKTVSFKSNALLGGYVKSCGCLKSEVSSAMNFNDLTGKRFGRLVALNVDHKEIDKSGNTAYYWNCKCDCGNEKVVLGSVLTKGDTKSCGCLQAEESMNRAMSRTKNLVGKRFGLLVVEKRIIHKLDNGNVIGKWLCKCDCGNTTEVDGQPLWAGLTNSCGCLKQSKYELYVSQYLCEHGFQAGEDYETQKRFDELRGYDEGKLSYDFAIYDNNHKLVLLIECQGQQHYFPVELFGGDDQFAKQQLHDEIKRKYSESIGVTLLEIPYTLDTFDKVCVVLDASFREKRLIK